MRDEDAPRRAILTALLDRLRRTFGEALCWSFDEIDPTGGVGLSLAFEGLPGMAEILVVTIRNDVIDFASAPGPDAHFLLRIYDSGAEYAHTSKMCHDSDRVLDAMGSWRSMLTAPLVRPSPLTTAERTALQTIGRARVVDGTLTIGESTRRARIAEASQGRLAGDVTNASSAAIFASFPRRDDGSLERGATALLSRHEATAPLGKGRETWLVAVGPRREREGDVIRLEVETPITENEPHVWDEARWLWDARAQGASEAQRLGVDPRDPGAARFLSLLDEGRFPDAFTVFGVALRPKLHALLGGQAVSVHDAAHTADWAAALRRALRRAAPWRFRATADRIRASRARPDPRAPGEIWIRLFALPHQRHQRKASLMLVSDREKRLSLDLDWTGSNARLRETLWTRPIEQDLRRLGLMDS